MLKTFLKTCLYRLYKGFQNFRDELMHVGDCKTTCERAYKFKKIRIYGDRGPGGHHFCYVERFAMMV